MSQQPFGPLDHHVRRRILRQLHTDFGQHSIDDLASKLCLDAKEVGYHGKVLAKQNTVRQIEGPNGCLLESMVPEDPKVLALLIATRAEDEAVPSDRAQKPSSSRAGISALGIVALLLLDSPLRKCLAALAEEEGSPKQLAGRLDLDENAVLRCCHVLALCGLAKRI